MWRFILGTIGVLAGFFLGAWIGMGIAEPDDFWGALRERIGGLIGMAVGGLVGGIHGYVVGAIVDGSRRSSKGPGSKEPYVRSSKDEFVVEPSLKGDVCPACGFELQEPDTCSFCGAEVPEVHSCMECGAEMQETDTACPSCGWSYEA